MIFSAEEKPE